MRKRAAKQVTPLKEPGIVARAEDQARAEGRLLPLIETHTASRSSARRSHSFANRQSRFTVSAET